MSELTKEETAQLVEDWCQDLEQNADKQGKGLLHAIADDGTETFCCLGRLALITKEKYGDRLRIVTKLEGDIHGCKVTYGTDVLHMNSSSEYIHTNLGRKIGFGSECGRMTFPPDEDFEDNYEVNLTEMNDDWDSTFPAIAKAIREHKGELFPILNEVSN